MSMKPILFNTDMVRAILAGLKTVTRRVVKPQPAGDGSAPEPLITRPGYWNSFGDDFVYRQPYQPGDILYVRETWCRQPSEEYPFVYRASVQTPDAWKGSWRPSIHMPKKAARIFLRVTGVRVERLHEITANGIFSEGIQAEYPIPAFHEIWDSTIKPADRAIYGWAANPWVWVIEFLRCEKPEVSP